MSVKHNSIFCWVILLIILVYTGVAGYFWYARAEEERIRKEKAANVAAADKRIVIYEYEVKRLSAEQEAVEAEIKAIEPKIKTASDRFEVSSAKQKEADDVLAYLYRKMDESHMAVAQYNSALLQQNRSRNLQVIQPSGVSQFRDLLAEEEKNLQTLQTELEKANCHYDCMGRESSEKKSKPSDKGVWVSSRSGNSYWKCKQHGHTFTQGIGYLDHKSEVSKILANLEQCQKQIETLKCASEKESQNKTEANQPDEPLKMAKFDSDGWNKRIEERRVILKRIQEIISDDRKTLNKLNVEKLELDSMARNIKRQIVELKSNIRNQRILIIENQK